MQEWQWYALLGLVAAFAVGLPMLNRRIREIQMSRAGLSHTEDWTDEDMRSHMAGLFSSLGYKVHLPQEGEEHFDLVLTDGLGHRKGVMTRHWRSVITDEMVLQVDQASRGLFQAPPIIMTAQRYTYWADKAARQEGVALWDLTDLARAMSEVRRLAFAYPDLPGHSRPESLAALAEARPYRLPDVKPTARTTMKAAEGRRRPRLLRWRKSK